MRVIGCLVLVLTLGAAPATAAETADPEEDGIAVTPPRLSLVEGQVSFWRDGAEDWAEAQINTPLAPGDELATGGPGGFELQVGARAFVRAGAMTQLGLEGHEPDYLQVKVTAGGAAFDLRQLEPGQTVEVSTPGAAFIVERRGYYRVDVTADRTSFIARRGGRALATPAAGEVVAVEANSQVLIEGEEDPSVATHPAPPLDEWDRWNYARTKELLRSPSAQYVSPGTYGVQDLDRHGTWRTVPTYGPVWVPAEVPSGWAPYTTGAWVHDPYYGWTWVDSAPWGWAPYHHGRWVYLDGYWAWAPGPVVRRAVYAPALVAFLGEATVVAGGGPAVGWVALGWGEPLVPWWGRPGFARRPSWRGWGGPRLVNNVVVAKTTVVNVEHITVYRNTRVREAVVVVKDGHFGRGRIHPSARVAHVDQKVLRPLHTGPHVARTAASVVPSSKRGIRPPDDHLRRRVVATRPPRHAASAGAREGRPQPRIVPVPPRNRAERAAPSRPVVREAPKGPGSRPASPPAVQRPASAGPRAAERPAPHQGRGPAAEPAQRAKAHPTPPAIARPGRPAAPQEDGKERSRPGRGEGAALPPAPQPARPVQPARPQPAPAAAPGAGPAAKHPQPPPVAAPTHPLPGKPAARPAPPAVRQAPLAPQVPGPAGDGRMGGRSAPEGRSAVSPARTSGEPHLHEGKRGPDAGGNGAGRERGARERRDR